MIKYIMIGLMFLFISCGGSFLSNYQNLSMIINTAIDWGLSGALNESMKSEDAYRVHITWSSIEKSINELILPMLKGSDPKIEDFDLWLDQMNFIDDIPMRDSDIRLLQNIINIIMSYFPDDKWQYAKETGRLDGNLLLLFESAFETISNTIHEVLLPYSNSYSHNSLQLNNRLENQEILVLDYIR